MKHHSVSGFCLRYVSKINTQPNSLLKNLDGFNHPKHYTSNTTVAFWKTFGALEKSFLDNKLAKTDMSASYYVFVGGI